MTRLPRVTVVTTGGTIASRREENTGAAVASMQVEQLLDSIPELADVAEVNGQTFSLKNSWDITPADIAALARLLNELGRDDAPNGFVVTHGTDTMEETAFALELLVDVDVPVVLTGAMRSADEPWPDGPRNLLDAVTVAASRAARGLRPTIVMAGEVHAARYVTKAHTTSLGTFASPGLGPIGSLDGDGVHVRWMPRRLPPLPVVEPDVAVDLVTMVSGLGDRQFRDALEAAVGGVVIEGSGSGNVHAAAVPAIRELVEAGTPVVLASRCGAGRVVPTYGGAGGGASLVELGVIAAGDLSGPKARLAMMYLLGGGGDPGRVRRWFAAAT